MTIILPAVIGVSGIQPPALPPGVGDASYVASQLPGVPTTQRQAVADSALAAATAIGGSTTQYNVIDTMAARIFSWVPFKTGKVYTDSGGTNPANVGDNIQRANAWIGSLYAFPGMFSATIALSASGIVLTSARCYMQLSDATYTVPAQAIVFSKANSTFTQPSGIVCYGTTVFSGFAGSNENFYISGDAGTNAILNDGSFSGEMNGSAGYTLTNATGLNLFYATRTGGSTNGTKSVGLGIDPSNSSNYLIGTIADHMIFNAVLSSTEKARINAFLKAFWSIP